MTTLLLLKLIVTLPFIFFVPGYFLTYVTPIKTTNRIERFVVAVFLSLFCVYLAIDILEKLVLRLTPLYLSITIVSINILTGSFALITYYRTRSISRRA